jgi:hypothetical protein
MAAQLIRGIQSLQEGYHIAVNFIPSTQRTLGDGGKTLSWNSIPIKSCFQTEMAHKPNVIHNPTRQF